MVIYRTWVSYNVCTLVCFLRGIVDAIKFHIQVMKFFYFEDHLVNPVFSFFFEILVFLSCLELIHVFSAVEKVHKISSLYLLLCLIDTKLMQ